MSDNTRQDRANALWGGRFAEGPAAVMQEINASIAIDQRLWRQDLAGSRAHCAMLAAQGIIAQGDADAIQQGLSRIETELVEGSFPFSAEREDIHLNIEARLAELIGPAAGRLHTARSRNDQVATDFRLWVRDSLDTLDAALAVLQGALLDQAERHADSIMPGFTHLQSAQPVTLGHHLMAYVEMLFRDRERLADTRKRLNHCPLGAAALAGTAFAIDRQATAAALGFAAPARNSLDAVSDRDFAIEYLSAASLMAMHLSRLAEELILWCSDQFRFVRLSDAFSTGSSIMPQKRNPDAAELIRAKTGQVNGALIGLLTVLKGLPLAYAKDMQEDKRPVFETQDNLALSLAAMTGMIEDMSVDTERMRAAAEAGFPTATDLADWLVRVLDMPFRDAHHVTGRIVKLAEHYGCDLSGLSLETMRTVEPRISREVFSVLSVEASVASRDSYGGTAPARVRAAIAEARARLT